MRRVAANIIGICSEAAIIATLDNQIREQNPWWVDPSAVERDRCLVRLRSGPVQWWPQLLRRIYEVDPLKCPACGAEMRVIAVIMEPKVIDRILAHLRRKGRDPRAGPWVNAAPGVAPPIAT